jgi:hypothetical protein
MEMFLITVTKTGFNIKGGLQNPEATEYEKCKIVCGQDFPKRSHQAFARELDQISRKMA